MIPKLSILQAYILQLKIFSFSLLSFILYMCICVIYKIIYKHIYCIINYKKCKYFKKKFRNIKNAPKTLKKSSGEISLSGNRLLELLEYLLFQWVRKEHITLVQYFHSFGSSLCCRYGNIAYLGNIFCIM